MVDALSVLKLGGSAAVKAGSLAFQKIARLRKIDEALKGIEDDAATKKLIDDFEIVKGSWRGEFTTTIDSFLRTFEASPLITAVFNAALVGSDTPSLKKSFTELFVSETGQDAANGNVLYDQVYGSFSLSAKYLTNDPMLCDIIQACHETVSRSIETIESSVNSIVASIKHRPDSDVVNEIVPKLVRAAISEFKTIKVETSGGRKEVDIGKIYIPPRLSNRDPEANRSIVTSFTEALISEYGSTRSNSVNVHQRRSEIETSLTSVSLNDLSGLSRVVVLGNPGGGKSTLLQSLCYAAANNAQKAVSSSDEGIAYRLPIRVILRDYERARVNNHQLGIFDYIINDLIHGAYADKKLLGQAFEFLLGTGQILLAFDGLDEILKTANRRQFVDLVVKFTNQYPLCQVLVTSREIGYDKAPLPVDEYETFILGEFQDNDVSVYAERFIKQVARKSIAEARRASAKFMSQTAQNAGDLRKNPLMLGLMMWIFNNRDDVPSNRPEIYQECASLMFERWDQDRDIIVAIPETFDRLQTFAYLASKLFEDEALAGGVPASWLEKTAKDYLVTVLESNAQAHEAAKALVNFIVERSWVMTEKGDNVFSFTHQTFLEYFFAKYISDEFDSVRELFDELLPHIQNEEWDVVSRLALQIKSYRNKRREDESIALLVAAMTDSSSSLDSKSSTVAFAIRCLEFLIGSEPSIRMLIVTILDSAKQLVEAGDRRIMDSMPLVLSGAKERRDFLSDAITAHLVSSSESDLSYREFTVACLDGRFGYFSNRQATSIHRTLPNEIVTAIRAQLLPIVEKEIASREGSARKYFEWTGFVKKQSVTKFGLDYLHNSRPLSTLEVDGLSAIVLSASGKYTHFFSIPGLSRGRAEINLRVIADYVKKAGVEHLRPMSVGDDLSNPPDGVWADMLRAMKADSDLRMAAIACYYIESKNTGSYPDDDHSRAVRDSVDHCLRGIMRAHDDRAAEIVLTIKAELFDRVVSDYRIAEEA
ncbi:MAG: NACHT domain-containing protein [Pseudomonadota bacterium]